MKKALAQTPQQVFIGDVIYGDFDFTDLHVNETPPLIPLNNSLVAVTAKRRPFSHEQEVRAIVWGSMPFHEGISAKPEDRLLGEEIGLTIHVELQELIESIVLAPGTLPFVQDAILTVVEKCNFPKRRVIRSSLEVLPPLHDPKR